MSWLGITYLVLGLFSFAMAIVSFGQGAVIRTDRSLFAIAGGCAGFGFFNVGVAFTSSFAGSRFTHEPLGYACAGTGMVLLTAFIPMMGWSLLDVPGTRTRLWTIVALCSFAVVRACEMVWRASTEADITWERLHLLSVSPLALPSGLLAVTCASFWVTSGLAAWRKGRGLGASVAIFGALAVLGAAKGVLMSLGLVDPPDTFGFMALPAVAFVQLASSVRFIDAVRTANDPLGDMKRYQILRKLGEGGMGDVFLARRRGPAGFLREVVLKTMRRSTGDPAARERFLAEARLAAQLRHPNIVDVYDLGERPDGFFIVMEHIEGITLGDAMKTELKVAPEVVAELGVQLCRALGYAHAARVIHRDLKPQNIMVTVAGIAKLIDFGIAQGDGVSPQGASTLLPAALPAAGTGSLTRGDGIVGTMGYMPPERLRGSVATASTDLFALGVVLYELLTLRSPFPSEPVPLIVAVEAERYERLSTLRPDCPPVLVQAIERCLAPTPIARPRSAAALEAMLDAALGDKRVDLAAWERMVRQRMARAPTVPPGRTTPMELSDAPTTPVGLR